MSLLLPLGCLLLAPSLLMATGLASSLALGTLLAASLVIASGLAVRQRLRCVRSMAPWLLPCLLALSLHLLVAGQFGSLDLGRALGSMAILALLVLAAATLADLLHRAPPAALDRLIRGSLVLLLVLGALGCIRMFQPFQGAFPKSVFPFTEPSHFALFLAPVLIAACATSSKRLSIFFIGTALAETAILQNLTMAVGCALAAISCLSLRHLALLLLIVAPSILVMDLSYYANRIYFDLENTNVSALVFLQGWQLLGEAWDKTHGFGLGFQQLGVNGSNVDAALLIQNLVGDDQNLKDGGFTLAKIISEFGAFGLAITIAYSIAALKSLIFLRLTAIRSVSTDTIHLIAASLVVGYALELFVRGAGYFTPSGILMLVGLFIRSKKTAQATVHASGSFAKLQPTTATSKRPV